MRPLVPTSHQQAPNNASLLRRHKQHRSEEASGAVAAVVTPSLRPSLRHTHHHYQQHQPFVVAPLSPSSDRELHGKPTSNAVSNAIASSAAEAQDRRMDYSSHHHGRGKESVSSTSASRRRTSSSSNQASTHATNHATNHAYLHAATATNSTTTTNNSAAAPTNPIAASSSSSYLDRQPTTQPQHHRLSAQQSWPQHQYAQQQQQQQAPQSAAASMYNASHLQPGAYAAPSRQRYDQNASQPKRPQSEELLGMARSAVDPIDYQQRLLQQQQYQQQLAYQQQQQSMDLASAAAQALEANRHAYTNGPPQQPLLQHHHPNALNVLQQSEFLQQPRVGRASNDRPLIKLSLHLLDTYKHINTVYYQERDARRAARQGVNNHGWDDENHDYILTNGEIISGRYRIKERIGKGSFGQVVRAEDLETHQDVAVKIIKSNRPFLIQAKTEIELLTHLRDQDPEDNNNIVRLLNHFMYRNHQCLVFEMLSINLYELLKNTQFGGVSLKLIRKFAKQVLKSLQFLARPDVDIIHCDLKPENILLRHHKKSGVKVIDFGSSCRSKKRMYSYIQSRFYRSPEVILGLPYAVSIDMWSLGCILAEMHTGEPLFSGSDQFDQMQKIVKILGMIPSNMLERSSDQHRLQFFEKRRSPSGREFWSVKQTKTPNPPSEAATTAATSGKKQASSNAEATEVCIPSTSPIDSLRAVITAENHRKKKIPTTETGNTPENYEMFVDLIHRMLTYNPKQRIRPEEALMHPFIESSDMSAQRQQQQYYQGTYSQRR